MKKSGGIQLLTLAQTNNAFIRKGYLTCSNVFLGKELTWSTEIQTLVLGPRKPLRERSIPKYVVHRKSHYNEHDAHEQLVYLVVVQL